MSEERTPAEPGTVFGAPDQADMIARIDAVEDDDLSSSFFDSSLQDVENAAVRVFDVGVRTLIDDSTPTAAFGSPPPAASTPPTAPSAADQPVAPGADGRFDDPMVRAAFILGGPAALPAE
jgi:hypothetical protein